MKKCLKITLIIAVVAIILLAIIAAWIIDNTRTVEDYNKKVVEIAKSIVTFHLKDGVFDSAYRETHYTTKLSAKRCDDSFISKTVEDNIVHGPIDLEDSYQGFTGDELYSHLKEQYSKFAVKLD